MIGRLVLVFIVIVLSGCGVASADRRLEQVELQLEQLEADQEQNVALVESLFARINRIGQLLELQDEYLSELERWLAEKASQQRQSSQSQSR